MRNGASVIKVDRISPLRSFVGCPRGLYPKGLKAERTNIGSNDSTCNTYHTYARRPGHHAPNIVGHTPSIGTAAKLPFPFSAFPSGRLSRSSSVRSTANEPRTSRSAVPGSSRTFRSISERPIESSRTKVISPCENLIRLNTPGPGTYYRESSSQPSSNLQAMLGTIRFGSSAARFKSLPEHRPQRDLSSVSAVRGRSLRASPRDVKRDGKPRITSGEEVIRRYMRQPLAARHK